MFCLYCMIIIVFGLIFFYFKFQRRNRDYIQKIEMLSKEVETRKHKIKIRAYHKFFMAVRHIYTHFKPNSVSVYFYNRKKELNTILMTFLYQIKDDKDVFTGKFNNIPITNIGTISKLINGNSVILIDDIEDICEYDNGLYEYLLKQGIKRHYFVNIYCNSCNKIKNKPIGFFVLTYKDDKKIQQEILIEETKRISSSLIEIIR